jgi:hypothetical protein
MHRAEKLYYRRMTKIQLPSGVLSGRIKLWYDKSS